MVHQLSLFKSDGRSGVNKLTVVSPNVVDLLLAGCALQGVLLG